MNYLRDYNKSYKEYLWFTYKYLLFIYFFRKNIHWKNENNVIVFFRVRV